MSLVRASSVCAPVAMGLGAFGGGTAAMVAGVMAVIITLLGARTVGLQLAAVRTRNNHRWESIP